MIQVVFIIFKDVDSNSFKCASIYSRELESWQLLLSLSSYVSLFSLRFLFLFLCYISFQGISIIVMFSFAHRAVLQMWQRWKFDRKQCSSACVTSNCNLTSCNQASFPPCLHQRLARLPSVLQLSPRPLRFCQLIPFVLHFSLLQSLENWTLQNGSGRWVSDREWRDIPHNLICLISLKSYHYLAFDTKRYCLSAWKLFFWICSARKCILLHYF